MVLTVLGTVIGLGALVATLGLSRTAGNRIVGRFDELAATEIVVRRDRPPGGTVPAGDLRGTRRRGSTGSTASSRQAPQHLDVGDATRHRVAGERPAAPDRFKLRVEAASPELFPAVRARLRTRCACSTRATPDAADRVAVLGPNAAAQLGISRLDHLPAIRIGDELFTVIGHPRRGRRGNPTCSAR